MNQSALSKVTEKPWVDPYLTTGVFNSEVAILVRRIIYYFANPVVLSVAIFTNIINVMAFLRAGISDGMTIIFLSLSVSDLLYNTVWFTERVVGAIHVFGRQQPYTNLLCVSYIIQRNHQMWYVISVLLTMFAAIQKCACIAMPFKFANFFTRRRTGAVVVTIFTVVIAYHLPSLSLHRMRETFDRKFNRTRLCNSNADENLKQVLQVFTYSINWICLPLAAQTTIIFCVAVMTVKLRQAASTRLEMKSGGLQGADAHGQVGSRAGDSGKHAAADFVKHVADDSNKQTNGFEGKNGGGSASKENGAESKANKDTVLNNRELRVIRSVKILCAIFLAGTAPYIAFWICSLALPEFSAFGAERTLYFIVRGFQEMIYFSSTAANILVYFRFNTKYRNTLCSMFPFLKDETK